LLSSQAKMLNKIQKKSHLRSLTSHKPLQQKPPGSNSAIRKEEGSKPQDQVSNSLANSSPLTTGTYKQNFNTIDEQDNDAKNGRQPLHQQPSSNKRDRDDSLRASITREVTTAKPIPQP